MMKKLNDISEKKSINNVKVGKDVKIFDFVNAYNCQIDDNSKIIMLLLLLMVLLLLVVVLVVRSSSSSSSSSGVGRRAVCRLDSPVVVWIIFGGLELSELELTR